MRSKKLLSLILAVCLVFSVISPAAAVQAGNEAVTMADKQQNSDKAENQPSGLVVSQEQKNNLPTLRDSQNVDFKGENPSGVINSEGRWTATKTEMPGSMLERDVPESVRELRELAKTHSAEEMVSAFVVLEKAPLVEMYTSINEVPESAEAGLMAQQNAVISLIEKNVLEGKELTVVSQFTYLTNAIVVETEFGNLESIAELEGVETVFITPVFYPATTVNPQTVTSGQMSGVGTVWANEDLGYSGQGMTIAILDTGLDLDHPSFEADPEGAFWTAEKLSDMLADLDLNAETLYNGTMSSELTADALYYNAKVPFAFNYAAGTTNVGHNDGVGDHGTHVAGIAAANEVEGTGVVGMAPNAQIIVMKVFSPAGGANMYDILNALEDCMKLGVDVANMSLGSPAGFTTSGLEEIDDIFAAINTTDLIVDIAAGNEGTASYGSLWGNYSHLTQDIDNATISSPSTYANSLSIASVDNAYVMGNFFALADDSKIFFQPSVEYLYGQITDGLVEVLAEQELEYVIVPNLGNAEDFLDADGNSIVEGKVAVVKRGDISFQEKAMNAEAAGAVAVLIWNNKAEDIFSFGMTTSTQDEEGNILDMPMIPVALVSVDDGQKMADAETKNLTVSAEADLRMDGNGGQMSSFSCWGVAPDLRLLPDFAGVGGNIYSCYDNGQYGLMSGTSMATPQVAGITALVLQYIEDKFPELDKDAKRTLVDALLMSTAIPVIDKDTDLEASPRQQGAGLVNALAAVTTGAYLSVEGSDRPKAELGESADGTYSFTFTVHNFSDVAQSYTGSISLLCEDYMEDENFPGQYFLAEQEHQLDASGVVCYAYVNGSLVRMDTLAGEIPAGGSQTFTVEIKLTDADKEWIDTYFPNGNYVEGFIYLEGANDDTVDLSLPFLGFYGDWSDARVFDDGFWYENGFWAGMMTGIADNGIDATEYYHVPWMSTGTSEADWVLGLNIYAEMLTDEDGNIRYDSKNNVVSPNGDGVLDQITDFYLSLMRNAKYLNMTYTDAEGNVVFEDELDHISKTMYNTNYGSTVPFIYSWYYEGLYDFTDDEGNYLPDGTELTLTITAVPDGCGEEMTDKIEIPVYVDTVGPQLVGEIEEVTEEGENYIVITFEDAHPAFAALMNKSGTQVYVEMDDTYFYDNGDGTYSLVMPVTGLGDSFVLALCDYGCNEEYYDLVWSEPGTNNPEVSADTLYAYQVYDEVLGNNYGPDYMYGWVQLNKETAEVDNYDTRDIYEYYAINAADYAGGYVFAVDAGGNLIYMIPGLWSRNHIADLGLTAVDMAFDEVSKTMYLAAKADTEDGETYGLYTVDLLTGETELVSEYADQYEMPWAMTFVEGELYCCKYYYSGFYQVDLEGETYELTQVTDAEGNDFMPKDMGDNDTTPVYAQSMTYSPADGVIYWAYYSGSNCELLTIDPENWTSTAVAMAWDQEFVALLTVEDDGFTLPESSEVTKLELSEHSVVLAKGSSHELSASTLPWNAPAVELTWESNDETVATVENGTVTAVDEGTAVITVSYGDISDSCTVNVVKIDSEFVAYNYYSGLGEGEWLDVNLATGTMNAMMMSPVAFIAADYNGHNGMIYGFDEFGQCYRYDVVAGECVPLGMPSNKVVFDMAYDYSSGLLYAIVPDFMMGGTMLYNVDMNTGALVEVAMIYDMVITLACDMYGTLYGINALGQLSMLFIVDSEFGGGGIMPWSMDGESSMMVELVPVMQTPVEEVTYLQSMCYDHENDVILWTNPETASIYWLNILADEPFAVNLGDPTDTGTIEWTGMFTLPEEIPELPFVPVASMEAEDMVVLEGGAKTPAVSVAPLNATNGNVTYVSADESIAKVEDGVIVGVSVGVTTITATVVDTCAEEDYEETYTCTFQVAVKESTGSIYGYLVQDVANYNGYTWINIPDTDPNNYADMALVEYNGAYMTLYSAEYVDGLIYGYGFDDQDWEANFQYLTIDPETWSVIDGKDMGDEFPFVYDMAFDYTTGTMYAVAGSQTATDLYMVDMATGNLIECLLTEPMFMSLAIDEDGTIYAMANSEGQRDPLTWDTVYSTAKLYTVDVENGTYELFLDTGVVNNMLASMAYDFDTGYIYWSNFGQTTAYFGGLYLIDPADLSCNKLGTIGAGGSQVTALISMADAYPEIPDTLQGLAITTGVAEVTVGGTYALETFQRPANLDVELTWTIADESIATVDENGVVTGVSAGTTTVTVSALSGDKQLSATASVVVYGLEDYFLTYNRTDMGFASINRPDSTKVTNLTEAEELAEVTAMEFAPNGLLYAYDEEGNLFLTTEESGFERTYIGHSGIEVREPYTEVDGYTTYEYTYIHAITDMAWDAANERMLAVGWAGRNTHYTYEGPYNAYEDTYMEELTGECKIYEVDLKTGALTELCVVGGEDDTQSSVYMLAVTDTGAVYAYSAYADYVMSVDLETGAVTMQSTLQNLGVYGSADGDPMAMTYDANTNCIYMLFTENGNLYYLYKFNVGTTALNCVGEIGTEEDIFAGLTLNEKHEHDFVAEEGSHKSACACGLEETTSCADDDKNHKCDVCGKVLSECKDENKDYKCDICGAELEKPQQPVEEDVIVRLAGENRFATATKAADQLKATLGVEKFDAIILANGYNFADALAGSYLSAMKKAPILLTWNGDAKYAYLNDATIAYVKANLAEGGTVYILGGTAAVPASIDEALKNFTVKRMDGANRFETNLMILEEAGIADGAEILVCTSTNFADSLSASAAGKPILLVWNESGKLYGKQPEFLAGLKNCTFTVIGGENAVSADLAKAVEAYGKIERLAGANRFETSVLVAEKYFEKPEAAVLAYAWDFPDGLCGGGLAFAMKAPLILTMADYENQAVAYIKAAGIETGLVLGGEKVITEASVREIFTMEAADEIVIK